MRLRISARKSDLARLQAYMVGEALQKAHPHLTIEYKFKESLGDINLTDPLWKIPQKGVFTEDFYSELINNETDLIVHSWKDLPTELKSDTEIAATLPRADQRDLLLVKKSHLQKVKSKQSLRIFSSSPRREYNLTDFLKHHLPLNLQTVQFDNVRGNIPTRIRKLLESTETDGLIVAKAALDRLLSAPQPEFAETQLLLRGYLHEFNWVVLPLSVNPNAAAQGALAVEIASHREDLKKLLAPINAPSTFDCALKERKILASFGGGCHQKIGVAVLDRPYGQITILRGLTDQGQTLAEHKLARELNWPQFSENDIYAPAAKVDRRPLAFSGLPESANAVFISRSEAWPSGLSFSGWIWTAGLKTWRSLAEKGIWVHGCSESMGEQEVPDIEILIGQKSTWHKLTHSDALNQTDQKTTATYQLHWSELELPAKKAYYWKSGSQFLQALKKYPELVNAWHGCGPGNTFSTIRAHLPDTSHLAIFLDEDDWRKQCLR